MPRRWLCILTVAILGCQSAPPGKPLPRYSNLDADAVRTILAQRQSNIHTMTARCELTLTSQNQQAIRLDGLLVMAPPDRVRMRVWKLDQTVFDVTALPEGVWIETAPRAASAAPGGPVIPPTVDAARLSRQLSLFLGGFFTSPGLTEQTSPNGSLLFRRDESDGASVVCDVDAATAAAQRFTLRDSTGKTRFSLDLSNYRQLQGIAWPIQLAARDADDSSEIDVEFSDVQFNSELAPRAFVPPSGAKKQP